MEFGGKCSRLGNVWSRTASNGRASSGSEVLRALHNLSADLAALPDAELLILARNGEFRAFRAIMQRNNLRLYRVARSVLGDDRDVEDVLQEAYVRAFAGLADFRAEATLSTWLTRIVLNEALGRVRKQRPTVSLEVIESATAADEGAVIPFPLSAQAADPEREGCPARSAASSNGSSISCPSSSGSCSLCERWRSLASRRRREILQLRPCGNGQDAIAPSTAEPATGTPG